MDKESEEVVLSHATSLYNTYVSSYADEQVYLPHALVQRVASALSSSSIAVDVIRAAYTRVLRTVSQHLSRVCFAEFVDSADYETCLLHFCDIHCGKASGSSPRKLSQNMDLHHLVQDTEERNAFAEFLKREFSLENLLFWEAVVKLRQKSNSLTRSERVKHTSRIYNMFLSGEGTHDITLPGEERERLRTVFNSEEGVSGGTSVVGGFRSPASAASSHSSSSSSSAMTPAAATTASASTSASTAASASGAGTIRPAVFDTALDTVEQVLCFDSLPRYFASDGYLQRRARKRKRRTKRHTRKFSIRHLVERTTGSE
jgi:Regulator of G protein signaling domain